MLFARVYPAIWAVCLIPLGGTTTSSRHSKRSRRHGALPELLRTPVRQLDDNDIWNVASYLTNDSLPEKSEASKLDDAFYTQILEYIFGPGGRKGGAVSQLWLQQAGSEKQQPASTVLLQTQHAWSSQPARGDISPAEARQRAGLITKPAKGDTSPAEAHQRARLITPARGDTSPAEARQGAGLITPAKGDTSPAEARQRARLITPAKGAPHEKATPRSARDKFYFLRHLRPDLPALDRIEAERTSATETEPPSTAAPPATRAAALTGDQRLHTVLRGMAAYAERVEGDEGTSEAVRLLERHGRRPPPPRVSRRLAKLVEDRAVLQARRRRRRRRRRRSVRPDMTPLTELMARESYTHKLINSFQTGKSKRHNSIKKELREPIDVDPAAQNVALIAAALRKRSAPERPRRLMAGARASTNDVEQLGVDIDARASRSVANVAGTASAAEADGRLEGDPASLGGAAYNAAARPGAAYRPRRKRGSGAERRVLDEIRIVPDLPDLMSVDPEDLLESEEAPLLPVLVSSGRDELDRLAVTERAALVFEDVGRPPTWSQWGLWGVCSVTCGPGQKARYRHCVQGPRCEPGERESDFKPCFRKSCSLPVSSGLLDSY